MLTFILCISLLLWCWPLSLLALILPPLVWFFLLPFRLIGIAATGVFELLRAIILFSPRDCCADQQRCEASPFGGRASVAP